MGFFFILLYFLFITIVFLFFFVYKIISMYTAAFNVFFFQEYDKLLVTTWGHDPGVIPTSNILLTLNDALSHSAVLIQVTTSHIRSSHWAVTSFLRSEVIVILYCYLCYLYFYIQQYPILYGGLSLHLFTIE